MILNVRDLLRPQSWLRLALLVVLVGLTFWLNRPVTAEPGEQEPMPHSLDLGWQPALPGTAISDVSGNGAGAPQIIARANESELMVVFSSWVEGRNGRDAYYSVSTDGGASWTTGAPILTSPGVDSYGLHAAYDASGTAHAVWIELDADGSPKTTELVYSRKPSGQGWSTPEAISSLSNPASAPIMESPYIVASGSNTLDLVWVEADQTNDFTPDVYHARSINGGSEWTNNGRVTPTLTDPSSFAPALVVADNGRLHLVWEESAGFSRSNISYVLSSGVPTGTSVTWQNASAPLLLNTASGNDFDKARFPRIIEFEGSLYVSLTIVIDLPGDSVQFVYLAECSSGCGSLANWTLGNVSGQGLDVNTADPFSVTTTMSANDQTPMIYFHGIQPGGPNENEQIWGIFQCRNWGSEGRDIATDTTLRAIYPDIVATSDTLHLTYEWVNTSGGTDHQVYHLRAPLDCSRYVYLPAMMRP